MGTGKRLQILLSTYNGERYLREQLDSFVAQTMFEQVSVLVRDDGSTDGTVKILREYQDRYGFEVILGENLGVTESMWTLLHNSDASCDYFAFSDQDDVWLPHKLELACSTLEKQDVVLPLLFASKSRIVDETLQYLGSSVEVRRDVCYYNAMVQNVTPGHTQVFNRVIRDSLLGKGQENIHVIDWWLYLVASGTGKVLFADEETVLHRQHGNNAVGYETNVFKKILNRLRSVRAKKGNAISLQLSAFYDRYADQMPSEYRAETEAYFANMDSISGRLRYVTSCRAFRQERVENWVFKVLYILGKYKNPKVSN